MLYRSIYPQIHSLSPTRGNARHQKHPQPIDFPEDIQIIVRSDRNNYGNLYIGNFEADKNGVGSISITTDLWCIGCEDETKNILGKAIIVHAGEDDCKSQPSGAAGARIACGVIEEI